MSPCRAKTWMLLAGFCLALPGFAQSPARPLSGDAPILGKTSGQHAPANTQDSRRQKPSPSGTSRLASADGAGPKTVPDKAAATKPVPATSGAQNQRPAFLGVSRVSTEEATRAAAANLARKPEEQAASSSSANQADDSAVVEFHPENAHPSIPVATAAKEKSILKNIHGEAYGSAGPGITGHAAGASVGGTSKSGKTSVYVETDHSRTSPTVKP